MRSLMFGGYLLAAIGATVSVLFWIPALVDRSRLRELLGSRYPLVYLVYSANGPLLFLAGVLLLLRYYQIL